MYIKKELFHLLRKTDEPMLTDALKILKKGY